MERITEQVLVAYDDVPRYRWTTQTVKVPEQYVTKNVWVPGGWEQIGRSGCV